MADAQVKAVDEFGWLAEKHFQYFSQLAATAAARLRKPDAGEWLSKLDLATDDVHAALDRAIRERRPEALAMAVDLSYFWQFRWMLQEGVQRLEDALDIEGSQEVDRAQGLAALSRLRYEMRQFEGAQRAAEEALRIARSVGDRSAEFFGLVALINAKYLYGQDAAAALGQVREAIEVAKELEDESLIAVALSFEGTFLTRRGDEQGQRRLEEALAMARRVGAKKTIAEILFVLADVVSWKGHLDLALSHSEEVSRIAVELGFKGWELQTKIHRVRLLVAAADPREALRNALDAVALAQRNPDPGMLALCLDAAGWAARALGDHAEARLHSDRAVGIARRTDSPMSLSAFSGRIWLSLAEGDFAAAEAAALESVEAARRLGLDLPLPNALIQLAEALGRTGRFDEAWSALEEARRLQSAGAGTTNWSFIPLTEAELLELQGRLDQAEEAYLGIIERSDVAPDVSESLMAVSRIRRAKSDPKGAAEAILRGLQVMLSSGYRGLALSGLEEGAAVLHALGKDTEAIEVLAWSAAIRAQTGLVVPFKRLPVSEKLKEELGVTKSAVPTVPLTGVLSTDLERAVETLRRGLD